MQLASCLMLTFALLVNSAPSSSPKKEAGQHLEQLLLDLQLLLRGVNTNENSKLSRILTFKFYMPKKATELKHLQCLEEELEPLQEVLNMAQSKNFPLKNTREFISNIRVTVQKLKGSEATFTCDYDDEVVVITEFLSRWITFCQSNILTLT